MRVIGLTGGVGSGKSRILKILQQDWQAEIIQADLVAKQLEEPGGPGYRKLVEALGNGILAASGAIDRHRLAALIFAHEDIRRKVNSIIHPMTWEAIRDRIRHTGKALVAVEAALYDQKADDIYDELWYVYTSKEVRITRLMESRGYSRERILAVMASQPAEEEYRQWSDFVLDNNGTIDEVKKQIDIKLRKQQETP